MRSERPCAAPTPGGTGCASRTQRRQSWESSLDGDLGTGRDLTANLSAGEHTLTLIATDGQGEVGQDEIVVTVTPAAGMPLPQITAPPAGMTYGPGTVITLRGTATDPEDGTLSGASLMWRSDLDGPLGTGASLNVTLSGPAVQCNPASIPHIVSLTARDSDGQEVTAQITIWIGIFC